MQALTPILGQRKWVVIKMLMRNINFEQW